MTRPTRYVQVIEGHPDFDTIIASEHCGMFRTGHGYDPGPSITRTLPGVHEEHARVRHATSDLTQPRDAANSTRRARVSTTWSTVGPTRVRGRMTPNAFQDQ